MIAAATCPYCGYHTAEPEHIIIDGVLESLALTCQKCGQMIVINHRD